MSSPQAPPPVGTTYTIKLESDGFNIGEIDRVGPGDTLLFINADTSTHVLTLSPGLSGTTTSPPILGGGRWAIDFGTADVDCLINYATRGWHDVMTLKIKVGGGGGDHKPRRRDEHR